MNKISQIKALYYAASEAERKQIHTWMRAQYEQSIQSKGGKARAENLTPERRSEIASLAAVTRWKGRANL